MLANLQTDLPVVKSVALAVMTFEEICLDQGVCFDWNFPFDSQCDIQQGNNQSRYEAI